MKDVLECSDLFYTIFLWVRGKSGGKKWIILTFNKSRFDLGRDFYTCTSLISKISNISKTSLLFIKNDCLTYLLFVWKYYWIWFIRYYNFGVVFHLKQCCLFSFCANIFVFRESIVNLNDVIITDGKIFVLVAV